MHLKEFSDRVIALGPLIRRPDLLKFRAALYSIVQLFSGERENSHKTYSPSLLCCLGARPGFETLSSYYDISTLGARRRGPGIFRCLPLGNRIIS